MADVNDEIIGSSRTSAGASVDNEGVGMILVGFDGKASVSLVGEARVCVVGEASVVRPSL